MKRHCSKDPTLQVKLKNISDITIKASIEAILVILLQTLKNVLSAVINFNKPSRKTFKNLGSFQGKKAKICDGVPLNFGFYEL